MLKICDEISYDSLGNLIFFLLFSSINSSNSDNPIYLSVGTVADPTVLPHEEIMVYICRLFILLSLFDVKGIFLTAIGSNDNV